jgi:hypothetical protein
MDVQEILAGKPPLRTIPGISCKRHPIVYCSIPKAGCTTIKHLLYYIDNGAYYPDQLAIHNDPKALLWARSEERDEYIEALRKRKITFTFVREPFARAYSAFNEKIYFDSRYAFPQFRGLLAEEYGAAFPGPGETNTPARHSDNFLKFLRLVRDGMAEPVRRKWDPHWAPQTQLLAMFRRYITIDLVGRLEAFVPAMDYVLKVGEVTRSVDLSIRFNEGPKPPYRLQEVMTPAILDILLDLYGEDIEHFGYGEAVKVYS